MTTTLASLARSTTRAGSLHSYLTIRWLVDRDLTDDAFRAYAYFRWLDDWLDGEDAPRLERLRRVRLQQDLLARARRGLTCHPQQAEEAWLVELARRDRPGHPGLRSYLDHMLAVMHFDADRRGRTIRAEELAWYSRCLSHAVMDGLSYFVGHRFPYPPTRTRDLAAFGAHIVHMLRDASEDTAAGYFNVPREYLTAHRLFPDDVSSPRYQMWVRHRLALARRCFGLGKRYIAGLGNLRVQLAGYAYCARFESTRLRLEQALQPFPAGASSAGILPKGAAEAPTREALPIAGLSSRRADESA